MAKTEKLLVSRAILMGDRKAFGRLVELYQSPIRRFFFNLTGGDIELSKDLAQETFIKAWINIHAFRALSTFSTWLYRIAYNTFYDHIRMNRQTVDITGIHVAGAASVAPEHTELNIDLLQALSILSREKRICMLLFYMEDKSIATISKITQHPTGTVKSYLSRGRKKIADYLKSSGYE